MFFLWFIQMNMIFFLILASNLLLISSSSWWVMWICLEMNTFFFIPWLMESKSSIKKTKSFIYFVIQSLASFFFIVANLMNLNYLVIISMMMKLGAFPFHSWMFEVGESLTWLKFLFINTIMKIGPMFTITLFMSPLWTGLKLIIFSIICCLGGFNSWSMRIILIYSSVIHLSWMILGSCFSTIVTLLYFLFYSVLISVLVNLLTKFNVNSLKDLTMLISTSSMLYSLILITLSSFLGIPPFIGFFMKLLLIKSMIMQNFMAESIILLILSSLPIYLYLKVFFLSFFLFKEENYSMKLNYNKKSFSALCLTLISINLIVWLW